MVETFRLITRSHNSDLPYDFATVIRIPTTKLVDSLELGPHQIPFFTTKAASVVIRQLHRK